MRCSTSWLQCSCVVSQGLDCCNRVKHCYVRCEVVPLGTANVCIRGKYCVIIFKIRSNYRHLINLLLAPIMISKISDLVTWNDVTWYSRLGGIVVVLGIIPLVSFYCGLEFARTVYETTEVPVVAVPIAVVEKVEYAPELPSDCNQLACLKEVSDDTSRIMKLVVSGIEIIDPDTELTQEIALDSLSLLTPSLDAISLERDFNFDGYKDLRVTTAEGMANTVYDIWMFNSASKQFEKDALLTDLVNPQFDIDTKEIVTRSCGGNACGDYVENTYQFINGSYALIRSVDQSTNDTDYSVFERTTKELGDGVLSTVATEQFCIASTSNAQDESELIACN